MRDWPRVRAECSDLLRYVRQAILQIGGTHLRAAGASRLEPICPDSPEWPKGQMAAFPLPPCDAGELKRRLYDEYHVEVPIIEWGGQQFVRVSIQGYNTEKDVGGLVKALKHLLGT